ncbi:MAG TPA: periplasmic heavy metal sensor [Bacteroidota bacterium]|nr:periplasmic heavy metal sensor [Bacteroidota bacterium]
MKYIVFIWLMLLTSIAWSQDKEPAEKHKSGQQHEMRGRPGVPGIAGRLKLTDEQRKKFESLSSALEKKNIAIRSSVMSKRVDLRDLFRDENPSKEKIEAVQNEIGKLELDLKTNRTDFWFDVNSILTPDQQKIWRHELQRNAFRNRLEQLRSRIGSFMHRFWDGPQDKGRDNSPGSDD